MSCDKLDQIIKTLKEKEHSTRCSELVDTLENLDFKCKKGSSGKHYTFKHKEFTSIRGRFDGAHGRDAVVLAYGVRSARDAISDLKFHLQEKENSEDDKK